LVVVADIQVRPLKTEVGKGFVLTAIEHELAGPKVNDKSNTQKCTYTLRW